MNTPDAWEYRTTGPAGAEPAEPAEPAGNGRLVAPDRAEELRRRLHEAVQGFVDSPEESVARADELLEETVRCVQDSLAEQRRALRAEWHGGTDGDGDGGGVRPGTEHQRTALLHYRSAVERLTRV
ncbi:YtxH domain-containing protein [Streptomyces aidingensis]|uniref:Uncharacterized protein n=1 Tax=Streptomyces aidingensis TaxID=910347 RepID=A0A1I1IR70_9ACTN|nr:YtxH domain-containing protein [Streptomyces aidingensis]SFC38192.1 hypothetical protein SAMN05421773_103139 [Streptomyces aidingensis]